MLTTTNPRTGVSAATELKPTSLEGVDAAARRAAGAALELQSRGREFRAQLLDAMAASVENARERLVATADAETGLGAARLNGEVSRSAFQFSLFAEAVREGSFIEAMIDHAGDTPLGAAPDVRRMLVSIGPVAVFGSSNFPLAFSNAGGDTASALAAGCPVIVKVHNAHPGTAMLVAGAVADAVAQHGLPEGVYSSVIGAGTSVGAALVAHPAIKAVGFTGSRSGGLALVDIAQKRREPIPVYAEMSSINPVFLFPSALTDEVATGFVGSLTLGSGQFCTNPGMLFVPHGEAGDNFARQVSRLIADASGQTMLTAGIREAFESGTAKLGSVSGVSTLGDGTPGDGPNAPAPVVFATEADLLDTTPELQDEIFGASSLVVRYGTVDELVAVAESVEGQLTATIHADPSEHNDVRRLLPVLERKVGRILYNGWPTGVEVNHSMVHGGPFPATSDSRTTSVGTLAIHRFLRPVAYQNLPDDLRPAAIADDNPWNEVRSIDGRIEGLSR